jgi:hypothetical protein
MHQNVRNAGITVMIGMTVAWMIGFISMFFRSNQDPLCWVGLAGGALAIVWMFRALYLD